MNTQKAVKLPLTLEERRILRTTKILLREIASFTATSLSETTGINKARCKMLIALTQFQTLGSIGDDMAQTLLSLGFTSIAELVNANPYQMYQDYSKLIGCRADPCVEDTFRCAVAQAKYPNLPKRLKQWWKWMEQRGQNDVVI